MCLRFSLNKGKDTLIHALNCADSAVLDVGEVFQEIINPLKKHLNFIKKQLANNSMKLKNL